MTLNPLIEFLKHITFTIFKLQMILSVVCISFHTNNVIERRIHLVSSHESSEGGLILSNLGTVVRGH
jgi:hypothetical protein